MSESEGPGPNAAFSPAGESPYPRSAVEESLNTIERPAERTEAERLPAVVAALSGRGHGLGARDERAVASAVVSPYVTREPAYDAAWARVREAGGTVEDYIELHTAVLEGIVSETLAAADVDEETAAELEAGLHAGIRTARESVKRPLIAQGRTDGAAEPESEEPTERPPTWTPPTERPQV